MTATSSKSVYLITNGCPENRVDMAVIHNFFQKNNWKIVDNYLDSVLIIFNACALTRFKEQQSFKIIDVLKANKPSGAQMIVCGCLPKITNSKLDKNNGLLILHGECDAYKLNNLIDAKTRIEETTANFLFPYGDLTKIKAKHNKFHSIIDIVFHEESEFRNKYSRLLVSPLLVYDNWLSTNINIFDRKKATFYIKIATGCTNCCTYCAVKHARGNLRSKSRDTVLAEFRSGLQQGYKVFSLLGTDLGPYGKDIGTNLVALLSEMIREKGDFKIRLRNTEPIWLSRMWDDLKEILKSGKIDFIGIPIESGNNEVLKAMRRGYKIEDIKSCIKELNQNFPNIFIRTQFITGFPGETSDQFQDTYNLLDKLYFDYAEVYPYSARPNTLAAKFDNQIPKKERLRRRNKLWLKSLFNNSSQKLKKIYAAQ